MPAHAVASSGHFAFALLTGIVVIVRLRAATVATVPTTTTVVVHVIAIKVSVPPRGPTYSMAVTCFWIQAHAIRAVGEQAGAAIPAVPVASADVVFVIAIALCAVASNYSGTHKENRQPKVTFSQQPVGYSPKDNSSANTKHLPNEQRLTSPW